MVLGPNIVNLQSRFVDQNVVLPPILDTQFLNRPYVGYLGIVSIKKLLNTKFDAQI